MKVGDLVKMRDGHIADHLGLGIVVNIVDQYYVWGRFQGWPENDKWIQIEDLEVLNESR